MGASLFLMPTSIQRLVSYLVWIFLITSLLNLTMATCQCTPDFPSPAPAPQNSSRFLPLKKKHRTHREFHWRREKSAHLVLWDVFSKVIGNRYFQSRCQLHFTCWNRLHAVIKGYTKINEKVPCSHIINKSLIKGTVKPGAQILSFILISIILLQHVLGASSTNWRLKGELKNHSAGGWHCLEDS